MHEWALAEAVMTAAAEIAEKEQLKHVTEVKVRIGELQQIDQSIFEFALSQLKPDKFKNAKFTTEKEDAKLKCRACGTQWIFIKEKVDETTAEAIHFVPEIAHTYIKCPKCGSPDFEILEGRGVWLETIKGEK
jgi:hydrogenase nickel incorporation protein HypA/HybF